MADILSAGRSVVMYCPNCVTEYRVTNCPNAEGGPFRKRREYSMGRQPNFCPFCGVPDLPEKRCDKLYGNERAADKAAAFASYYLGENEKPAHKLSARREDLRGFLEDMLADVMHLCDRWDFDMDNIVSGAIVVYDGDLLDHPKVKCKATGEA